MASPARANSDNLEENKLEKNTGETKPEAERPLNFSDFENAVEVPKVLQAIISKELKKMEGKSREERLIKIWDLAADELVAMVKARKEGPEIDELLDFQEKINKILEKNGAAGDQEVAGETDLDETVNLRKKK